MRKKPKKILKETLKKTSPLEKEKLLKNDLF